MFVDTNTSKYLQALHIDVEKMIPKLAQLYKKVDCFPVTCLQAAECNLVKLKNKNIF